MDMSSLVVQETKEKSTPLSDDALKNIRDELLNKKPIDACRHVRGSYNSFLKVVSKGSNDKRIAAGMSKDGPSSLVRIQRIDLTREEQQQQQQQQLQQQQQQQQQQPLNKGQSVIATQKGSVLESSEISSRNEDELAKSVDQDKDIDRTSSSYQESSLKRSEIRSSKRFQRVQSKIELIRREIQHEVSSLEQVETEINQHTESGFFGDEFQRSRRQAMQKSHVNMIELRRKLMKYQQELVEIENRHRNVVSLTKEGARGIRDMGRRAKRVSKGLSTKLRDEMEAIITLSSSTSEVVKGDVYSGNDSDIGDDDDDSGDEEEEAEETAYAEFAPDNENDKNEYDDIDDENVTLRHGGGTLDHDIQIQEDFKSQMPPEKLCEQLEGMVERCVVQLSSITRQNKELLAAAVNDRECISKLSYEIRELRDKINTNSECLETSNIRISNLEDRDSAEYVSNSASIVVWRLLSYVFAAISVLVFFIVKFVSGSRNFVLQLTRQQDKTKYLPEPELDIGYDSSGHED